MRFATLFLFLAPLAVPASPPSRALDAIYGEMPALLAARCKSERIVAVRVVSFVPTPGAPKGAGMGLARRLADAIKRAGVRLDDRAPVRITGTFQLERSATISLLVTLEAADKSLLARYQTRAFDAALLTETYGPTGVFSGAPSPRAQMELIGKVIRTNKSSAVLEEAWVRPGPGSPLALQLLVKRPGTTGFIPAVPQMCDGQPTVGFEPGSLYRAVCRNDAGQMFSVALTIDGQNVTNYFAPAPNTRFLLRGKSQAEVRGYPLSETLSAPFNVESYVPGTHFVPAETGLVTMTVYRAWPKGTPPPAEEVEIKHGRGVRTRPGKPIEASNRLVESEVGRRIVAAVTIRYRKK